MKIKLSTDDINKTKINKISSRWKLLSTDDINIKLK